MTEPPWTRPTIDESADIELIPFGRSHAQQERQERLKRQGRWGLKGCLFYAIAFALLCVYCAGYMNGRHP